MAIALTGTIGPLYAHPAFNASIGTSARVKESGDPRKWVLCGSAADIETFLQKWFETKLLLQQYAEQSAPYDFSTTIPLTKSKIGLK
jgi:hypothetical protein